jgi:hypothetical protein
MAGLALRDATSAALGQVEGRVLTRFDIMKRSASSPAFRLYNRSNLHYSVFRIIVMQERSWELEGRCSVSSP